MGSISMDSGERNMKMRYALLALCALALTVVPSWSRAQTSQGTDFWVMFDENYSGGAAKTLFISGGTATTGTVSIPGLSFSAPFSVTPDVVTGVVLPAAAEVDTSDTVGNLGIHVTALAPV